jgi:hypothetical protein
MVEVLVKRAIYRALSREDHWSLGVEHRTLMKS